MRFISRLIGWAIMEMQFPCTQMLGLGNDSLYIQSQNRTPSNLASNWYVWQTIASHGLQSNCDYNSS